VVIAEAGITFFPGGKKLLAKRRAGGDPADTTSAGPATTRTGVPPGKIFLRYGDTPLTEECPL